jgi:hypothetical protein
MIENTIRLPGHGQAKNPLWNPLSIVSPGCEQDLQPDHLQHGHTLQEARAYQINGVFRF